MVSLLCVTTINWVLFEKFFKAFENLPTFVSSRGASTSSKMQIGAGLDKKTANKSDKAVKACSPPDNKLKFCSFFPGGLAYTSKPA